MERALEATHLTPTVSSAILDFVRIEDVLAFVHRDWNAIAKRFSQGGK